MTRREKTSTPTESTPIHMEHREKDRGGRDMADKSRNSASSLVSIFKRMSAESHVPASQKRSAFSANLDPKETHLTPHQSSKATHGLKEPSSSITAQEKENENVVDRLGFGGSKSNDGANVERRNDARKCITAVSPSKDERSSFKLTNINSRVKDDDEEHSGSDVEKNDEFDANSLDLSHANTRFSSDIPHLLSLYATSVKKSVEYVDRNGAAQTSNASRPPPLHNLYLQHNQMHQLPRMIGDITSLRILDVSFNNLSSLPLWIGSLSNLHVFHIRSNCMQTIPEQLKHWTKIKTVSFYKNKLKGDAGLRSTLVGWKRAESVDFSHNFITTFPDTCLHYLKYLATLNLNGNLLTKFELPENVKLTFLKSLRISKNSLTQFPANLTTFTVPNITELDLSENLITYIAANTLGCLITLKEVNLRRNQLESVPSDLERLKAIEVLDLRMNPIIILPPELGKLSPNTLSDLLVDSHDSSTLMHPPPNICQAGSRSILDYLRSVLTGAADAKLSQVGGGIFGNPIAEGKLPHDANGEFLSGIVKEKVGFRITARDKLGRLKESGGDCFVVEIGVFVNGTENEGKSKFYAPHDNLDGTYAVSFDARVAGVYVIDVTTGGERVGGSPFRVRFLPGPADASQSYCLGRGTLEAIAGQEQEFLIYARDRFENSVPRQVKSDQDQSPVKDHEGTLGGGKTGFAIKAMFADDEERREIETFKATISPSKQPNLPLHSYKASYSNTVSGHHLLAVTLDGREISGSPLEVTIYPGPASATHCIASATGLHRAEVGVKATFVIFSKDRFDNPRLIGGDAFTAALHGEDGSVIPAKLSDSNNGEYYGSYVAPAPGRYQLDVRLIVGSSRKISGSPFEVTVVEKKEDDRLKKQKDESEKLANELAEVSKKYELLKEQTHSAPGLFNSPRNPLRKILPRQSLSVDEGRGTRSASLPGSRRPSINKQQHSRSSPSLPCTELNEAAFFQYEPSNTESLIDSLIVNIDRSKMVMPPVVARVILLCASHLYYVRCDIQGAKSLLKKVANTITATVPYDDPQMTIPCYWLSNAIYLQTSLLHDLPQPPASRPSSMPTLGQATGSEQILLSDAAKAAYQALVRTVESNLSSCVIQAFIEPPHRVGVFSTLGRRNHNVQKVKTVTPHPVLAQLKVLKTVLAQCCLHAEVVRQVFAEVFFFIDAMLINALLVRKSVCNPYSAGILRENLSELDLWAAKFDLADEACHGFRHIRSAAELLLLPLSGMRARDAEKIVQERCWGLRRVQAEQLLKMIGERSSSGKEFALRFLQELKIREAAAATAISSSEGNVAMVAKGTTSSASQAATGTPSEMSTNEGNTPAASCCTSFLLQSPPNGSPTSQTSSASGSSPANASFSGIPLARNSGSKGSGTSRPGGRATELNAERTVNVNEGSGLVRGRTSIKRSQKENLHIDTFRKISFTLPQDPPPQVIVPSTFELPWLMRVEPYECAAATIPSTSRADFVSERVGNSFVNMIGTV